MNGITAHQADDGWWIAEGHDVNDCRHIRASKFTREAAIERVRVVLEARADEHAAFRARRMAA